MSRANVPVRRRGYQIAHGHSGAEGRPARAREEPVLEVGLEAARVGAPEHGQLGLSPEPEERLGPEELPPPAHEERGILGDAEDGDAQRIGHVGVEDALDTGSLQRPGEALRVVAVAERLELHVEASLRRLLVRPVLQDVDPAALRCVMARLRRRRQAAPQSGGRLRRQPRALVLADQAGLPHADVEMVPRQGLTERRSRCV